MSNPPIFFAESTSGRRCSTAARSCWAASPASGLVALGGRLAHLQLIEAGATSMLSANNQFNFAATPPPRGLILDRNGVVLASNRPDFRLLLAKDKTIDVDAILAKLAQLIPIDDAHRAGSKDDIDAAPQARRWR